MRTGQPNFSRGEIGPDLYGRFDVDAYAAAVRRARNVIVMKYGGLTKRPGTRLVAEVIKPATPVRLVPFQFSIEQAYALEFGQAYMAPCALGGRVVEDELVITAVSNAANAQVTAAFHGYLPGDRVYITGLAPGSLADFLNGRFWEVVSVQSNAVFTIAANTAGLSAFAGCVGGIVRTGAPPPPPPPPTVPPVVPPPDPPVVGGGGGSFRGDAGAIP